jgi:hypothetical protein
MNITKNFTLEELVFSQTAIDKGIDNTPSQEVFDKLTLLCEQILQPIRDKYGDVIVVSSGFRCVELNKALNGSTTSQHVVGEAADIITESDNIADNKRLFDLICDMIHNNEIVVGQLINEYNYNWIHISLPTPKHKNQIFSIK